VMREGGTQLGSDILELDVRNFNAGIYIFEVYDNKRVLIKRFIKI
jgi:hypothetical protein